MVKPCAGSLLGALSVVMWMGCSSTVAVRQPLSESALTEINKNIVGRSGRVVLRDPEATSLPVHIFERVGPSRIEWVEQGERVARNGPGTGDQWEGEVVEPFVDEERPDGGAARNQGRVARARCVGGTRPWRRGRSCRGSGHRLAREAVLRGILLQRARSG